MSFLLQNQKRIRNLGRWAGWLAGCGVLLSLLTGYGITQARLMDFLTVGVINKAFSQHWHEYMGIFIFILMVVHVTIALWGKTISAKQKD